MAAILAVLLVGVPATARADERAAPVDPSRLLLGRTALPPPEGTTRWTVSDFLLNDVAYGSSDAIEIGLRALTPITYVGLFPSVGLHHQLSAHLHAAARVGAGVLWPWVEPEFLESVFTGRLIAAAVTPALTWATPRLSATASVDVIGLRFGEREFAYPIRDGKVHKLSRVGFTNHLAVIPMLGASWTATRVVALHAEAHLPFGTFGRPGDLALIAYGVRLTGSEASFDLGFLLPVSAATRGLLAVSPLGLPVLSSGFAW